MTLTARYDGHADWYDNWNKPHAERNAAEITKLLGPGDGLCLDLGCGGGHYFDVIAATGRTVIGLDYSADQLRIARGRSRRVVRGAGASHLPGRRLARAGTVVGRIRPQAGRDAPPSAG